MSKDSVIKVNDSLGGQIRVVSDEYALGESYDLVGASGDNSVPSPDLYAALSSTDLRILANTLDGFDRNPSIKMNGYLVYLTQLGHEIVFPLGYDSEDEMHMILSVEEEDSGDGAS